MAVSHSHFEQSTPCSDDPHSLTPLIQAPSFGASRASTCTIPCVMPSDRRPSCASIDTGPFTSSRFPSMHEARSSCRRGSEVKHTASTVSPMKNVTSLSGSELRQHMSIASSDGSAVGHSAAVLPPPTTSPSSRTQAALWPGFGSDLPFNLPNRPGFGNPPTSTCAGDGDAKSTGDGSPDPLELLALLQQLTGNQSNGAGASSAVDPSKSGGKLNPGHDTVPGFDTGLGLSSSGPVGSAAATASAAAGSGTAVSEAGSRQDTPSRSPPHSAVGKDEAGEEESLTQAPSSQPLLRSLGAFGVGDLGGRSVADGGDGASAAGGSAEDPSRASGAAAGGAGGWGSSGPAAAAAALQGMTGSDPSTISALLSALTSQGAQNGGTGSGSGTGSSEPGARSGGDGAQEGNPQQALQQQALAMLLQQQTMQQYMPMAHMGPFGPQGGGWGGFGGGRSPSDVAALVTALLGSNNSMGQGAPDQQALVTALTAVLGGNGGGPMWGRGMDGWGGGGPGYGAYGPGGMHGMPGPDMMGYGMHPYMNPAHRGYGPQPPAPGPPTEAAALSAAALNAANSIPYNGTLLPGAGGGRAEPTAVARRRQRNSRFVPAVSATEADELLRAQLPQSVYIMHQVTEDLIPMQSIEAACQVLMRVNAAPAVYDGFALTPMPACCWRLQRRPCRKLDTSGAHPVRSVHTGLPYDSHSPSSVTLGVCMWGRCCAVPSHRTQALCLLLGIGDVAKGRRLLERLAPDALCRVGIRPTPGGNPPICDFD
eukprot:TRINITY_DN2059_c0_g1_i1.p1 TRINITY_DN2059_c0_g1~~TRINITY_DN2059_c0_g1_i1.p1  ORF type:complete len:764 (+),score=86.27 TRINITY_DN2059_c0_g1_i1:83-2374(+)